MKVVRIGNNEYRAKQCGKDHSGVDKYYYQFRYLIFFGLIPLSWDNHHGTYTLKEIEQDISRMLRDYTGEIPDLTINPNNYVE